MWGINLGGFEQYFIYHGPIYSYEVVSCGQHPTDDLRCTCIFNTLNTINSRYASTKLQTWQLIRYKFRCHDLPYIWYLLSNWSM